MSKETNTVSMDCSANSVMMRLTIVRMSPGAGDSVLQNAVLQWRPRSSMRTHRRNIPIMDQRSTFLKGSPSPVVGLLSCAVQLFQHRKALKDMIEVIPSSWNK